MDTHFALGLIQCIDLLYESVVDSSYWTSALQAVNRLGNGSGALYLVFGADNSLQRADTADIPMEALQLYSFLYHQDARRDALRRLPVLEVFNDERLPDRKAFERTDCFNLVLKPYDMPNHVLVAIPQSGEAYGALIVERPEKLGPAGRQEEEVMRLLGPHFARAVRMQRILGGQRSRVMLMEEVLERLPHPIALLNADGKVLRMSLALRELLRVRRGLFYRQERLRARRPQDNAALEKAFAQAVQRSPHVFSSTTLTVAEPHAGPGLVVTVHPLPWRPDAVEEARCFVVIRDPNSVTPAAGDRLMHVYALTRAEARLAETLIGGASLQEAADLLQVSVNTCKTQLQSVYRKTDCHNRAELARAVLSLS